jgi:hypothetical protein
MGDTDFRSLAEKSRAEIAKLQERVTELVASRKNRDRLRRLVGEGVLHAEKKETSTKSKVQEA